MEKAQSAHRPLGQFTSSEGSSTPQLLLSIRETAKLLGVSKRTVFLLLETGDLRRKKVRRRTMILRDEVVRFAQAESGSN